MGLQGRGQGTVRALLFCVSLAGSARAEPEPIEISVHGEAPTGPAKEPSVAGSVIRQDRMQAPGLKASDVLRSQPGVGVLETGGFGALSTASVRGATAAQIPVYVAGVRINDDVGGAADLSMVPLWLLHRIEIYRSHAPLSGDRLGIGGAIFFEPRRPHGREASVGGMVGSYGANAGWAYGSLGDAKASVLGGLRFEEARNDYPFRNDRGTRFDTTDDRTMTVTNADARIVDGWLMGSLRLPGGGRANAVLHDVQKEQGMPGLALYPSQRARAMLGKQLFAMTTDLPCSERGSERSSEAGGCRLEVSTAALSTQARYDDPLYELSFGSSALEMQGSRLEQGATTKLGIANHLSLSPAVRASFERLGLAPSKGEPLKTQRLSGRASIQAEWSPSEHLVVRAAGSGECAGTSVSGHPPWVLLDSLSSRAASEASCHQAYPEARAGIETKWGSTSVLATIGRYVRLPTLAELYGMSVGVRGNTELVPETGISGEVGVRAAGLPGRGLSGLALDVFAFVRSASDLIAYNRGAYGYARPYNVSSARVLGLELLTRYRPLAFLLVEVSGTLRDARDQTRAGSYNDKLPYQPAATLVPRLELSSPLSPLCVEAAKLAVSYWFTSSYTADAAGLIRIPSQGSLDLDLEIAQAQHALAVRGRLSNVLDQTRFDLVGMPLPGRTVHVAMEAKW